MSNKHDYELIKKLIDEGKSINEIGAIINASTKHLYEQLKKYGIKINKQHKYFDYSKIEYLASIGKTTTEMIKETNIPGHYIRRFLTINNISYNKFTPCTYGVSMLPLDKYKAYYLGVIFGDGHLGKDDQNHKNVDVSMCDLDVLKCINNNVFDNKVNIGSTILPSGKLHYELNVHNKYIWKELMDNFKLTNNKSSIIIFPELDKELLPHFVRGLVDSDGSFYFYKNKLNFCYGTRSYDFINSLKQCFINNINMSNIKICNCKTPANKDFYTIRWTCNNAKKIGSWIYQDSENNRGERKYNIWKQFKNKETL